ncbi:MAG: 4-hydroxy-tetrahydrodipicolinate synthase [Paludibacteraceae bacterium]|nr:4-hydroxy-tetrahydrodipicolinate synthase [Paludibacteraceae bacterium]
MESTIDTSIFKGLGVALITPFKADGSVDFPTLLKLVEYQVNAGTNYLVIFGTTAESPTLTDEERAEIKAAVVKQVDGRIPIVLGIGGNNTQQVVSSIKNTNLEGISAILSVVPYYNKPSQEGIYQHYRKIAESTDMPIILYNVPGRTGTNMNADTTLRLAHEFKNIIAVKEASGNFRQIDEIIKKKPTHFMVISGDDAITFPLITLGAMGVISVVGNAFPKEFGRMVHLALAGELEESRAIHYRFVEMMDLLFVDGNPAGVKRLMSEMGLIENALRLPLVPTTIKTTEKIRSALNALNRIEK